MGEACSRRSYLRFNNKGRCDRKGTLAGVLRRSWIGRRLSESSHLHRKMRQTVWYDQRSSYLFTGTQTRTDKFRAMTALQEESMNRPPRTCRSDRFLEE
jgi:hypothetical protein